MTEKELRLFGDSLMQALIHGDILEEKAISDIQKTPELIHTELSSGANLFLFCVLWNQCKVVQTLAEMGADIHRESESSMISGNALNVARTPEMADYLLGLGLKVETNLSIREKYWNPAVKAAGHNDVSMLFYWLHKEKELFKNDRPFLRDITNAVIEMVDMMNQSNMLAAVVADRELYPLLKEHYTQAEDRDSIKLSLAL